MRNIPDNMQIWKIIVVFTTMFRKIRENGSSRAGICVDAVTF